jgi:hypothetical protein
MTPITVRGVPRSLQRDAWWIAADSQTGVGRGGPVDRRPWWLLTALVVMIDLLVLRTSLGLGFVIAIFALAGAAHWGMRDLVTRKTAMIAWGVLIVSLIPAFDVVQLLSFVLAIAGLTVFAAMITGPFWARAAARLPFYGLIQTVGDLGKMELRGPGRGVVMDWLLPVVVGTVFVVLMVAANPLVEGWLSGFELSGPDPVRIVAWVMVAIAVWPLLRLARMKLHGVLPAKERKAVSFAALNARSVLRALIVFNVIFAVQSVLELGYLWGGVRLPDGMTYANYAHRGAYPLMLTALLAGAFALVAQPWLESRMMRVLLLVWVGQTLVLVMSSILRLDLYVDVYGLTHLRFAAFVWMAVVALGLVVLVMQIVGHQSTVWMLKRSLGVGFVAVYICLLTNVSGLVARHHLNVGPLDAYYVCELGAGASVEIAKHNMCVYDNDFRSSQLNTPKDLRDWGFRNWRLRRSLDAVKAEAGR